MQDFSTLGRLLIGLTGLITNFFLQRDAKKIRELERDNKKYKGRLLTALNAIKGYQAIEQEYAESLGLNVKAYRTQIRKEKQDLFNSSFLSPSRVDEMMKDLEKD